MKIVIVMPALNESDTIGPVVRAVSAYGMPLVVDDASSDDTASIAETEGAIVLKLPVNRGYEGALEAGFAEAEKRHADVVATFDSDGQFDAGVLDHVLRPIREGRADLVLGERPRGARFAERLFGLYTGLRHGISDILCGVKAYRIELYRSHGRFDEGRAVGTELALAAIRDGARFETVPVPVKPRERGGSRFGDGVRANLRLLTAMRMAVCADLGRPVR